MKNTKDKIRKMKFKIQDVLCFVLYFVFCISYLAHASSGASFLKLGVGARALAMGSAYTAVANDATSLHWNPAGLSRLARKEISFTHTELYADSRFDFVGYAMPIGGMRDEKRGMKQKEEGLVLSHPSRSYPFGLVLGIGAVYLSQGSMEGRSEERTRSSNFEASDMAISLGISKLTHQKNSLGMNVKLIQSKIAGFSSTGYAFDLGFQSHLYSFLSYPVQLGFAVQNIGPQMKFINEKYNLPMTLNGGARIQLLKDFLISADLKHQPNDQRISYGFGTEFSFASMLSLRAGYSAHSKGQSLSNGSQSQISNLVGFGLGAGFKIRSMIIDYAFTPAGELGNKQNLSLNFKF